LLQDEEALELQQDCEEMLLEPKLPHFLPLKDVSSSFGGGKNSSFSVSGEWYGLGNPPIKGFSNIVLYFHMSFVIEISGYKPVKTPTVEASLSKHSLARFQSIGEEISGRTLHMAS
jgi:hypothetical protein